MSKNLTLLNLSLIWFSAVTFVTAGQAIITLKPDAVIQGDRIHLKEVARIEAGDGVTLEELLAIDLGSAPEEGHQSRITRFDIIHHLRRHKVDTRKVLLQGADKTQIRPPGTLIQSKELLEAVFGYVRQSMGWNSENSILETRKSLKSIFLPMGDVQYRFNIMSGNTSGGTVIVNVHLIQEMQIMKSLRLNLYARVFGEVLTLNQEVEKGDMLKEHHFSTTLMELNRLPRDLIELESDAMGMVATRRLTAGDFVTKKMLTRERLMKRGQIITLKIETAILQMSTTGKTMENGYAGDTIQVKNLDSGRLVTGLVVDKDTVLVEAIS